MSQSIPGSCLCGTVRFEVEGEPRFVSHCHCENCRRAHGAGFVTYAGYREEECRLLAGSEDLAEFQQADTGSWRRFCQRCGSTLFFSGDRWAGEVHVAVANLDGELDRLPSAHAYADRSPAWCPISDGLPCYGGDDGNQPL